ncbi:hypothetical protein [Chryseobacterium luquanense]|uniref:CDI immunity protein domain-containing protein n=1 Tax=Chryseobacterium luquanense TaxID=2983766 RepID=A0ABT3Y4Q1_9FLAO|nr:hypothetical protein [Chryseobacterium luquanense]MCX8533074.1 hypothetical protein [Chryseobacterium luquanense]
MEVVRIAADLEQDFIIDLVDEVEVFNHSRKTFSKCEYWGWNNEGENGRAFYDFGLIGDFHFDIYRDKMEFYYGDTPHYGIQGWEGTELIFLPVGSSLPEDFLTFGHLDFTQTFERPKTLKDFIDSVKQFYERLGHHKEYLIKTCLK